MQSKWPAGSACANAVSRNAPTMLSPKTPPQSRSLRPRSRVERLGLNQLQHFQAARTVAFSGQQPTRAFRQSEAEQCVEKRGKRRHAQHPSPGIFAHARQQRVRHKSDQDAKNNVELKHSRQLSAMLSRRDFRNYSGAATVECRCPGRRETRHDERGNIGRQPEPTAPTSKERQSRAALLCVQTVRRPAPDQRAHHRAVEGGSHGNPVESGTKPPERLNGFFRARMTTVSNPKRNPPVPT